MSVPAALAATMPVPGAEISGLRAASLRRGPRHEPGFIEPSRCRFPTASASSAAAGEVTLDGELSKQLPAATTKSVPVSRLIRLTACDRSSVPSVGSRLPRLMLITEAPCAAAHSIPAMMPEKEPLPESSSTLPFSRVASGATPLYLPPEAAPVPAVMLATWVPCPTWSTTSSASVKF